MRHIATIVRRVTEETPEIKRFELADPDEWDLPPFRAGAHITVHLPHGGERQYSLCGDPADRKRYAIAVKRESAGRGGSAWLVDALHTGASLGVSLPRNHFPLATDGARHVFVAGGIGVTPFIAMAAELGAQGKNFRLLMCARSRETTPFLRELETWAKHGSAALHLSNAGPGQRLDLAKEFLEVATDTHVYCCGPERMIAAFERATAHWPADRIHIERFAPPPSVASGGDQRFVVQLARSGREFPVEPGQTIHAVLRAANIAVEASCEVGLCGTCCVRFLSGTPIHRDYVLGSSARKTHLATCISRCATERLVLDL